MVKWLIGLFAIFAVASANGYGAPQQYQQQTPEAPVLPKGGVEQYVAAAAPVQPIYQPQEPVYAPPPPPPQQQPPVYQPVYAPQPPPQQTSPVPPPAYGPPPPAPPQQQPPQQTYAPQRPLVPDVPQYVQQAPPAPAPRYEQPAPPPAQQPPQTYAPQQSHVQQAPPAPQQPSYSYAPAPQQQPSRPAEDYCQRNNLIDGYHVEGCKPFYFACTPISTTRSRCPKGLFYDVEAQLCDYKHLISACGGKRPLPPPPPQQQPPAYGPSYQQPQAYAQQASYQQPQQQPARRPEFDCSSKSDGVYVRGCSSKYYICMLGTSTTLSCPSGTFYSASAEKCDYKAHVTECGGIPPPPPPPAQNPTTPYGQAPAYQQKSYGHPAPPPPQQQEPANECTGLSNGIYGRKCNEKFVACTGGKAVDFTCPTGQAFNLKTVKCAPKIEIQTCPEYEIPQQQEPAPQYVQQAPPAPAPQTYAPPPPPPAQQPPQTYAPQQSYVQQAPPAPQQPSYSYAPAPQQQPSRPAEDYCQRNNLNDGYHVQGCQSHYFACSALTTTRITCPQGLFYDMETQNCDYKHLIAACGGKRPLPPPQQQPPAYTPSYGAPPPAQQPPQTYAPQQSYVQQAPPAPQQPSYSYAPAPQQQPSRPVEDYCQKNNLNDGYHVQGCQPHYFACSAFTTTRLTCPQGLFFDMETQNCDYKHLIAACGGKRPLPPPQQQPPAYTPSYGPPPAQQPPQQPSYVQQAPPAPQYNPAPQGTY